VHSLVLLVKGLIEKVELLRLLGAKLPDLSFERIDLESKKVSFLDKLPQLRYLKLRRVSGIFDLVEFSA
jgi:hypothetical protein